MQGRDRKGQWDKIKTGQDRTRQDRVTGQNRTGRDRTGLGRGSAGALRSSEEMTLPMKPN